MKHLVFLFILCFVQHAFSQSQKTFILPLASTIDATTLPDSYDAYVLNIKAQPHPASGSEILKLQLNNDRKSKQRNIPLNKTNTTNGATAPIIIKGFDGKFASSVPNDNHIAISNGGKIVSVVNSIVYIYDTNGTKIMSKALGAFSNSIGVFSQISDPRILYDPEADRFIILYFSGYLATNSTIIVGFSKTNDPAAAWNFYKVPGNPYNDTSWSDYPILALTHGELFFTFNLLQDGVVDWRTAFKQSIIWQVDKQKGYAGDSLTTKVWGDIKFNNKHLWNICPAQGGSGLQTGGIYFVSVRPSDLSNDSVFVTYISNTMSSGNAQLSTRVFRQDHTYGLPPNVPMPNGNYLQTNDARVLCATIENNILHYVQNSIDTTFNTAGIYYGKIVNPQNNNPTLNATIIRNDTMDFGYPSIAYVGSGLNDHSVMITCSHSSLNVKPGTSVFFADRNGLVSSQVRCKDGDGWINVLLDTNERWGDYTGIQRKYNEQGVVWLSGSYTNINSNSTFNTWIAKVKSTDATSGIPTPQEKITPALLYPNPSSNIVTVEFETAHKTRISADVYDLQGKLVAHVYDDAAKGGVNRFSFNIQNFSKGNYFLQITTEGSLLARKQFIVN